MQTIDDDELEILGAYDKGELKSISTKAALVTLKAAARATAIQDRRVAPPSRRRTPKRRTPRTG